MKNNYRYDRISSLSIFLVSAILIAGVGSCKSKTAANENGHTGHSANDMAGMDMKEPAKESTVPKLEIKVEDLIQPVNKNIISQVATFHLQKSKQELTISAKGRIEYDQRRFTNIASRATGRIETTDVKFQFQPVKKGQLLFTIYSPELVNAQQELLLLSSDANNKILLSAAREKLILLGLGEEQILQIKKDKKPLTTVAVYAPATGYIIAGSGKQSAPAMANSQGNMGGDGMGSASTSNPFAVPSADESILREGQYVNKGETVFRIVNTEMVWGMLKIFPDDVSKIKIGNPVTVDLDNNENNRTQARIDFIEKYFNAEDKTITARVYLTNQNSLYKIGDLISASISCGEKEALWVPRGAILDIGNSQVVFVKQGNAFRAKQVHIGLQNGGDVELLSGTSLEGEVATNAQYLVDSEAFIKTE